MNGLVSSSRTINLWGVFHRCSANAGSQPESVFERSQLRRGRGARLATGS